MQRRNFLGLAAAVAAVDAVDRVKAATTYVKGRAPEDVATDEGCWAVIRNEFTIDRSVLNMNNGHVSPAPRTVQEAMRRYLDYSNMGPYHTMILELEKRVETARRMVAEAAGCDPEEIAITRNS